MGLDYFPVILFSSLWGFIGIIFPFFVPRGPDRGVTQVCLRLVGACCWLFWLCCYMCQMNPLIGPIVSSEVGLIMQREWGNPPNRSSPGFLSK